jgi:hypothetical protein
VGGRLWSRLPAFARADRLRPRRAVRRRPRRSVEKLFYLPEAHTDFLLAVIAEELGFVGVLVVIVLFGLLIQRAFAIGRQAVASSDCIRRWWRRGLASGWACRASSIWA